MDTKRTVIVTGASQGRGAVVVRGFRRFVSVNLTVTYLTEGHHVTGEMLHVDDRAHVGQW